MIQSRANLWTWPPPEGLRDETVNSRPPGFVFCSWIQWNLLLLLFMDPGMIEKSYTQFCVIREMKKKPHLNSLGECGQTSPATIPDKSCDPVMCGLSPRCKIVGELLGRTIYCIMADCRVTRMVLRLTAYSTFHVTVDNLLLLFSHFVKGVGGLSLRFLYRYFEFLWLILGPLLISGRYFPLQKTSFWKNIALLLLFLLFLEKTSANLSIKLRGEFK